MRILQVWNTANILDLIFQGSEHQVSIVHREPIDDPFKHSIPDRVHFLGYTNFEEEVVREAKPYDVVHIHILHWLIPMLRKAYPDKKLVIHHHGNNLREDRIEGYHNSMEADLILYSTPDLKLYLPADSHWLPNPVDERIFHKSTAFPTELFKKVLYPLPYWRYRGTIKEVQARFPEAYIWARFMTPLPHAAMPGFLSQWGKVVEWKPDVEYERMDDRVLSMTALEALKLGCMVYYWPWGQWITEFPEEHLLENVIKRLNGYYQEAGIE